MSHESERSGAAVGIAIAVALIVVVFGFILVAGAGLFFYRFAAVQNEVILVEEQALQQQAIAEPEARRIAAEIRPPALIESPVTAILTIALDESGNIQLNGETIDLDQLRKNLEAERQHASDLQVIVTPVAECKTEHVSDVVSACLDSAISHVQVRVQE